MPTIIDSLVVKLGIDSSNFKENATKASRTGKELEKNLGENFSNIQDSFTKASTSAASFLSVLGGFVALKEVIQSSIDASAAVERFSKNVGTATPVVSSWINTVQQFGGTSEGLISTFSTIRKAQTDLLVTGTSSLQNYFYMLGVSLFDANGNARKIEDVLLDVGSSLQKYNRPLGVNIASSMGIDPGTINMLLSNRKELEKTISAQQRETAISKVQGESAVRLSRAQAELSVSSRAFGRAVTEASTPALESLAIVLKELSTWTLKNSDHLIEFFKGFGAVLGVAALAIVPLSGPAGLILGLAVAIGLLTDDYKTWKNASGESFIDWDRWGPGIEKTKQSLHDLKVLFQDIVYRTAAAADGIWKLLTLDWKGAKMAFEAVEEGMPPESGSTPQRKKRSVTPQASGGYSVSQINADVETMLGLPRGILEATMIVESNGNPDSVSQNNARGRYQFIESTRNSILKKYKKDAWSKNRAESAEAAGYLIKDNLEMAHGDVDKAILYYLLGPKPNLSDPRVSKQYQSRHSYLNKVKSEMARIQAEYRSPAASSISKPKQPKTTLEPSKRSWLDSVKDSMFTIPEWVPDVLAPQRPDSFASPKKQGSNVTSAITNTIGPITINTQATDAGGIASALSKELDWTFTAQGNKGLS